MKVNTANTLTLIRIAAIPAVVYCFYSDMDFARPIAGIVFARPLCELFASGYRDDPVQFERTVTLIRLLFPYIFFITPGGTPASFTKFPK